MNHDFGNESAFPIVGAYGDNQWNGMSLRQYYAGQAMQALIGHENKADTTRGAAGVPKLAKYAVEYADALIAALAEATRQEKSK